MNIVRVVFEEFLQVADKLLDVLDGEWDYPTFVEHVERLLNDLGKNICREALEAADDWLKDNPKERQGWTVVRRDPKSLLTPFGEVHYQRRYYHNRKTGAYAYLLDQAIGVTPHERIDSLMKTRLVDAATDVSYRKAGKQGTYGSSPEDAVSGQTVMNVIRETFSTASPTSSRSNGRKIQTRYLHVQADEDHIKKQDGGTALAKLVYTTDGYGRDWGERRALNNVHYIAGVYRDNEVLYQEVYENIDGNYDIDSIEKIYVYGDGAPWIRGLAEYLGAVFVLDKYHINKCITESLGFCPELRSELLQAVKDFDLKAVKSILGKARKAAMTENEKQRVAQCRRYLVGNWDGIIAWKEEAPYVIGCSAEGHVRHVLSSRLSSRPMGWSERGADQMAKLRAMKANGLSIKKHILHRTKFSTTLSIAIKAALPAQRERLRKVSGEVLGNMPVMNGSSTYTRRLLKQLSAITII